jgi:tetratricopeptide (TPR) repeat protein
VGRYRILEKISEGGMGVVYEAEQENPRRQVALKLLLPGRASPERMRRFELEGEVLGRLEHPGIARIYEAGLTNTPTGQQPFLAMELVRGLPVTEYVSEARLMPVQRLELLARIADAVQHAHGKGVIHRDLKPSNILVDEEGQPKVLDFGVARVLEPGLSVTNLTLPGMQVGTLQYMSPEQALGHTDALDTRTDVYSLGVLGYELLAGQPPYALPKDDLGQALQIIREHEPAPLSRLAGLDSRQSRLFRGDVDTILGKALEKDPERRYVTAADLAADIRRCLRSEPIAARPPSAAYQFRKFARRHRAVIGGAAAAVVALIVGLTVALFMWQRAEQAKARAEQAHQETRWHQVELAVQRGAWGQVLQLTAPEADLGTDVAERRLLYRAMALDSMHRGAEALALLDEALAKTPMSERNASIVLLHGELCLAAPGRRAEGLEYLREAVQRGDDLAAGEHAYAQALLAETMPEAIGLMEDSLTVAPRRPNALTMLAVYQLLDGQADEARRYLTAAEVLFPEDPGPRIVHVIALALEGDAEAARAKAGELRGVVSEAEVRFMTELATFLNYGVASMHDRQLDELKFLATFTMSVAQLTSAYQQVSQTANPARIEQPVRSYLARLPDSVAQSWGRLLSALGVNVAASKVDVATLAKQLSRLFSRGPDPEVLAATEDIVRVNPNANMQFFLGVMLLSQPQRKQEGLDLLHQAAERSGFPDLRTSVKVTILNETIPPIMAKALQPTEEERAQLLRYARELTADPTVRGHPRAMAASTFFVLDEPEEAIAATHRALAELPNEAGLLKLRNRTLQRLKEKMPADPPEATPQAAAP